MYCNIRGLKSKLTCISDIASEIAPEIFLIAETQLKNSVGVRLKGYTFFGRTRTEGNGGGVGILVKNEIKQRIAPHHSDKDIEIIWISVRRHEQRPLYIGVYYGKQESRITKAEIEHEMAMLVEELMERQTEGDILLAMDGNGKIGLMKEPLSRNGKLLLEVFEETELCIMNKSEKCEGTVTRQNTKNGEEKSAIDFVVCTPTVEDMIYSMVVDEEGLYKVKGKTESDHNSILIELNPKNVPINAAEKRVVTWRLKAPEDKWRMFREKLCDINFGYGGSNSGTASMSQAYGNWVRNVETAAIATIGKTTHKNNYKTTVSEIVTQMRKEKRELKNKLIKEQNQENKKEWREKYIRKQCEVRKQIEIEKRESLKNKINKMINSGDQTMFWKERRNIKRDETEGWLITKDGDGKRLFTPEENLRNIASYYENLFAKPVAVLHPYHDEVRTSILEYQENREYENEEFNQLPTIKEIKEVIDKKKNGKATTDLKNEIIKGGGNEMINAIYPIVTTFWEVEQVAHQWNKGIISSIWKGKGDKEKLENHRGITVSSAIGTIPEEIINRRILKIVPFTQFQAGGRKGCSPVDHVFIIRGIISFAMNVRKKIILTFYDVQKAYDRADISDMMHILWKHGVRGKLWRLAKALNINLTAQIKTKFGLTRKIIREGGGKQGGQIIVTMFSKLMDTLSEEMIEDEKMGIDVHGKRIGNVLFVDDVATLAEGRMQQEETLKKVHDFAVRHKVKWGSQKCNVLEIGRHREVKETWKLGGEDIKSSDTYKYLGDIISRNGTNKQNVEDRTKKVKNSTREIMSCGNADIMKDIELNVCLKLHEIVSIPMLLNNCESWNLTQSDKKEYEKIEIWALKRILGLPRTTPTAAVRFITGTLFTEIRIDEKQMLYLHKVLNRTEDHWTHHILMTLDDYCIGWSRQIRQKLSEYGLETNWDVLKRKTDNEWKSTVKTAIEKRNRERLLDECKTFRHGCVHEKTKTKSIIKEIERSDYCRTRLTTILSMTRLKARAIVMARYGMLDCSSNFGNKYGTKQCKECRVIDDEAHRMNNCKTWRIVNRYESVIKIDFNAVFSNDKTELESIADEILSIWDLKNGKNCIIVGERPQI